MAPVSTEIPRRVVVTGIGAVTPIGKTAATTWENLVAGRSGVTAVPTDGGYDGIPAQIGMHLLSDDDHFFWSIDTFRMEGWKDGQLHNV